MSQFGSDWPRNENITPTEVIETEKEAHVEKEFRNVKVYY